MRRVRSPKESENKEVDIDLAPMLALMVTLIPILLLSSAFVHVRVIETSLPQAVAQIIKKNLDDEKNAKVSVQSQDSGKVPFAVTSKDGKTTRESIKGEDGKINREGLIELAHQIKSDNPNVFRVEVKPSKTVNYESIVTAMDLLRQSASTEFDIVDPDTGEQARTNIMFPDVVFVDLLKEAS